MEFIGRIGNIAGWASYMRSLPKLYFIHCKSKNHCSFGGKTENLFFPIWYFSGRVGYGGGCVQKEEEEAASVAK